jgi:N-acetylmuramoyl-L-alanine amidase
MAFDKPLATITIYCEASSEDHTARLGVAWTIINRLRSARFGDTVAEVCLKRLQFSEWNADQADNFNLLRAARCPDDDSVMLDCGTAYDQAYFNAVPDPTHGATHYHDTSIQPPAWAKDAIRTVQLGRLIFYRGVK